MTTRVGFMPAKEEDAEMRKWNRKDALVFRFIDY